MPRTIPSASRPHFVVDGSNIATEGRAMPSLGQLNEAVLAFIDEHPEALITVVVDATFGHRIDKKEVAAFDAAVANNELVTPPAGAVGRGDAFVLTIAHKAKAGILSNDSFQEFHGDYPWLFDAGRLIGGKPVPHVGWVFVERLPVRGPKSRMAVKEAKGRSGSKSGEGRSRGSGSPLAEQPMPVPTAPPPGPATPKPKRGNEPAPVASAHDVKSEQPKPTPSKSVNDLLPFLEFAEKHPVGTSCTVVVESYASHGAYARAGDVLVYLPLRLMGNPMPRSARAAVTLGEAIAVVIAGYVPERRSIDAALPSAAEIAAPEPDQAAKPRKRAAKKPPVGEVAPTADTAESKPKRSRTRKSTTSVEAPIPDPTPDPVSAEPAKPVRRGRKQAAPVADAPASPNAAPAETPTSPPAPVKRAPKKAAKTAKTKPADTQPGDTKQAPAAPAKRGRAKSSSKAPQ